VAVRRDPGGRTFPWHGHRTALIAARGDETRRYLKEALTRAGYRADVYADLGLIEGPDQTEGRAFLVLDPAAGGLEAVRRFRGRGGRMPIIHLWSGPSSVDSGRDDAGDPGLLSVPFTPLMLERAIEQAVRPGPGSASRKGSE
jgi:DNA-binding response OmpR family regulator